MMNLSTTGRPILRDIEMNAIVRGRACPEEVAALAGGLHHVLGLLMEDVIDPNLQDLEERLVELSKLASTADDLERGIDDVQAQLEEAVRTRQWIVVEELLRDVRTLTDIRAIALRVTSS